jgi:hypothetical protein
MLLPEKCSVRHTFNALIMAKERAGQIATAAYRKRLLEMPKERKRERERETRGVKRSDLHFVFFFSK